MNPFLPYLPMYAPGTVPDRPWWRTVGCYETATRSDGHEIVIPHGVVADVDLMPLLDAFDAAHPLPVPPVLAGQVWTDPHGFAVLVGAHSPTPHRADESARHEATPWPLGECCLVWGPLAPWAPAGWRP